MGSISSPEIGPLGKTRLGDSLSKLEGSVSAALQVLPSEEDRGVCVCVRVHVCVHMCVHVCVLVCVVTHMHGAVERKGSI